MKRLRQFAAAWLLVAAGAGVCAAQSFGSPEAAARVMARVGRVSVLKDSQPWALEVGSVVYPKQVIVSGEDGFASFQLSDGSTFEVFPNSRLVFRDNPGDWKDLLDVWLGRVKVYIHKLTGGQPNYNRIRTPTAVISVRGTVFDVAVEDEDSTLISVEEGQVAVQHAIRPFGEPRILNAGEYLRVHRNEPLVQRNPMKGNIVQQALRAAAEAIYRVAYGGPSSGGGVPAGGAPAPAPSGGGGTSGDTDTTPPPPPPPGP
ncbi:MAG: FecR domain-containing protein [Acidobacteria bacterium]|nr:FecR domain-containing protein [Acidobacteriota bacterium]MBI3280740.1 FecR domain-containing protein [Acidobacteriota bacterium]